MTFDQLFDKMRRENSQALEASLLGLASAPQAIQDRVLCGVLDALDATGDFNFFATGAEPVSSRQRQVCDAANCGHQRDQHDRNGCSWPGCNCKRTYMDLSLRKR